VGYANGDIGYIPTAAEYEKSGAYAPYVAPRFYGALAFRPEIESTVLSAARRVLERAKTGPS
jgi:hypothetical protein